MIKRLADLILEIALPAGAAGEDVRNDLEQELEDLRNRHPARSYRFWYLWEAMKLGASFAVFHLTEGRRREPRRKPGLQAGRGFLGSIGQDLRFAARTLRRRWVFSLAGVLTLGLGIGSATAMFSVVDGVLLKSVPFRDPGRLVDIWLAVEWARDLPGMSGRMWDRIPLSLEEYRTLEAASTTLEGVAAHNAHEATLTGQGPAERITMGIGSAALTSVLGVEPILGRWFLPGEEGFGEGPSAPVTVISHDTWTNRLGSDPGVLGKTLFLNGMARTIVGVLPETFRIRHLGRHSLEEDYRGFRDAWIPVSTATQGNGHNLDFIGRLAPGVTVDAATVEARHLLSATMQQVASSTGAGSEVRVVRRRVDETLGLSSPLALLMAATGILLLISCANVATLALGEFRGRIPELSTRAALGAGGGRIVRQLLTESVLLGLAGTGVGAALAVAGTKVLVAMAPPLPRFETVGVDVRVLAFAALLGILAGVLLGTLPAFLSARSATASSCAKGRKISARRGGSGRWFASVQIALTAVLLVAGGLLGRSFQRLLGVEPGFEPDGLATVQVFLPEDAYEGQEELVAVYDDLVAVSGRIPGVTHATATTRLPFPGHSNVRILSFPGGLGGERISISAQQIFIMPGYHETMGIPLVAGEGFGDLRVEGAPTGLLITENMARRYWPQDSPLGARLGNDVVMGIVGDVRRHSLRADEDPAIYASLRDQPSRQITLIARTRGDAGPLARQMQDAVRAFDEGIPIRRVTSVSDLIFESTAPERYRTFLMGAFATLATLLAGVGVFGVTARRIAWGSKEMGVRMSLGAEDKELLASVVRDGLLTGVPATLAGLIVAGWAGRLFTGLLFGVEPFDPLTFAAVACFLVLVVVTASYFPARKILRLDPARVLRAE